MLSRKDLKDKKKIAAEQKRLKELLKAQALEKSIRSYYKLGASYE